MSSNPSPRQRALRLRVRIATVVAALLVAACSSPEVRDETAGWSAQKIYTDAREEMRSGSWERAIKLLEALESKYPFGRFAQQAQLDIAYSYWKNNDLASAVAACDRFIKLYPNHEHLDYVLYLRGLIYFNEDLGFMGKFTRQDQTERDNRGARESFDTFKNLVTRFPDSKYSEDARLRLRYLVNALAQYEIHVARYYMRRGAFVAAANRAQFLIQNYPNTPANEEALFVMFKAYEAMGMNDLRDSAKRVLDLNFPNSEIVRNNGPKNTEPWWKLW
ncbi:MAG: outer membrane protein assembly factor BamD [Burkholderiales bacterium]|nr:outer membrane protein assembly factor BamD [Burkholderiales bacterium]